MDLDSLEIEQKVLNYTIDYYKELNGCFEKDATKYGLSKTQILEGQNIINALLDNLYKKQVDLDTRMEDAVSMATEMTEFLDPDYKKKEYLY